MLLDSSLHALTLFGAKHLDTTRGDLIFAECRLTSGLYN